MPSKKAKVSAAGGRSTVDAHSCHLGWSPVAVGVSVGASRTHSAYRPCRRHRMSTRRGPAQPCDRAGAGAHQSHPESRGNRPDRGGASRDSHRKTVRTSGPDGEIQIFLRGPTASEQEAAKGARCESVQSRPCARALTRSSTRTKFHTQTHA